MDFALSMRSAHVTSDARRWHVVAIAAALALMTPSFAGADVVTSDFNTPQVVCAQKVQRNCVWNWQALADESETPGTSGQGLDPDGLHPLLTDETTDALWPDFTAWADDLMYRRWTRPIGVGNPFPEGEPRAPSQEVLSLVAGGEQLVPSQQVPEPSSLSLLLASMAVGIGVLARTRRRSTKG